MADLALVARETVRRGQIKTGEAQQGKTIVFPPGTMLIALTGPDPGQIRYGITNSILVVEHGDLPEILLGDEPPVLMPDFKEIVKGRVELVAWVKPAVKHPEAK